MPASTSQSMAMIYFWRPLLRRQPNSWTACLVTKADIIAFLAAVAFESHHFSTRASVPTSESTGEFSVAEPGPEKPCAIRRGLVVEENGVLLHFCVECGRFGRFGVGVSVRQGRGIAASIGHGPKGSIAAP
jgi:hypothetical protein